MKLNRLSSVAHHSSTGNPLSIRWGEGRGKGIADRFWQFVLAVVALGFTLSSGFSAGRQLAGQHAPASSAALAPAEAQQQFVLLDGFEARLFAAEPDVINPVAMTWDERGRLWVLELYEYPIGAKPGEKPRDRIKILEDTDNDGRADKVTVFADGLNLATGLLLGNEGVYVGQAPELLFLQDTNQDDRVDTRTVLLNGFGLEDRHELLNGFAWGPDGWLYMTHGVFTQSKVKIPEATEPGVIMNAAIARFHSRTKKFEVFAEGTSNPWGVDFDRYGNAFVSACVIDHLFHMVPGGSYQRQAGTPLNPYTYGLLPSIVDHTHHMAAYSGICIYEGNQFPEEYRGRVFMGNIHQNAVNHDRLIPNGSSFKAVAEKDFLTTIDGWFRPVSQQVGPDGALWIADWYDKYPCYQNAMANPAGVDREFGRIWRVVWVGAQKGKAVPSRPGLDMNLAKLSTDELAVLLESENSWQRRQAQRLISGRGDLRTGAGLHAESRIHKLAKSNKDVRFRLAALWTLHSANELEDDFLELLKNDPEPAVRAWVARLTGERGFPFGAAINRLAVLAIDTNATVRLAVAVAARQFVSGSLTVDTPPAIPLREVITGGVLSVLHKSPIDPSDPVLPFICWMALEPIIAVDAGSVDYYENAKDENSAKWPMNAYILTRIMRRICDLSDPAIREKHLNTAVRILGTIATETNLASAALDGLIEGSKNKGSPPTMSIEPVFQKLTANPAIADKARHLAALWGEAGAIQRMFDVVNDTKADLEEQTQAIQTIAKLKSPAAREAALKLVMPQNPEELVIAALRALSETGGDTVGQDIIERWKTFSPAVRRVACETLTSRARWAANLLSAVELKTIAASELSATTIRALSSFVNPEDEGLRRRFEQSIGRVRSTSVDKQGIIEAKKKMILAGGEPDLKAGHELTKKTCFVCHKLNGEGAEVGPDLTGSGRSTLDALLANVIDPNQIVGKGFENVEVETKDGRSVSGRLVEDTASHVKLLGAGPKEEIVARSDIAQMRVSELSLMPEGLEQMPDADFRNLILYILNPQGE